MRRWVSVAVLVVVVGITAASGDAPIKDAGYLVVHSTPFARIHIDGKDTGRTTPIASRARIALAPGRHKLTFVVGEHRYTYTVMIETGKTTKITKQLPTD